MRHDGAALLIAALCAGCGGEQGERPKFDDVQGGAGDPCLADDELEFFLVEDFEKGRATNWWVMNDGLGGSTMDPPRNTSSPPSQELDFLRCEDSERALRVTAGGLVSWGAFGFTFHPDPFDASDYQGLSFWARRGDAPQRTLFVSVGEKYTDQLNLPAEEAFCVFDSDIDREKCDPFGAGIGLEREWRFYRIQFDSMKQRAFGKPSPNPDPDRDIAGIKFSFESGDWDIWVDDVAFFRKKD
jgi:hypothetical protein